MPPPMPPARVRQSREDRQQRWPKLFCVVHPRSISRHKENRKTLKKLIGQGWAA
jgi:hypothetical protein